MLRFLLFLLLVVSLSQLSTNDPDDEFAGEDDGPNDDNSNSSRDRESVARNSNDTNAQSNEAADGNANGSNAMENNATSSISANSEQNETGSPAPKTGTTATSSKNTTQVGNTSQIPTGGTTQEEETTEAQGATKDPDFQSNKQPEKLPFTECETGAQWRNLKKSCEPTCTNRKRPKERVNCDSEKIECICNPGHVRKYGACVSIMNCFDCDDPLKFPTKRGADCASTCKDKTRPNLRANCPPTPQDAICMCRPGYVKRTENDDTCIPISQCPKLSKPVA